MADFPSARYHLPAISSFSAETSTPASSVMARNTTIAGASSLWPSANLAIYVPFRIWSPYLVNTLWWANGTATNGNTDVGIYSVGGTLITSAGSTAQTTVSTIQKVALGTPIVLSPGSYYMAMAASTGTTCQYMRVGQATNATWQLCGWAQQATAFPLPATATFAAFAQTYQPFFGIATATVI